MIKRLVQVFTLSLVAFLTACGGGSSSTTNATVDVTPVAGKFTSGTVDVFNSSGTKIGSATVSSTTGKATVTLNSTAAPSIMVFRVSGGSFYDEANDGTPGTNDFMLSVTSAGSNGGSYTITPLTHMAAAFAGIDGTASTISVPSGTTALSTDTIVRANKLVPYLFGLDPALLDITTVPTLIDTATPTLSASISAIQSNSYAYVLALLSFNAKAIQVTTASNLRNSALTASLFAEAKKAYALADKSIVGKLAGGTFNWPSGMTEVNSQGRVVLKNYMPTASGLGYVFAQAGADQIINSRIDVQGDIGSAALLIGQTQNYAATAPGAYCPNYRNSAGQQVLDPTDPKNQYIFYTATGAMSSAGFMVSQVGAGPSPTFYTVFGAGGANPNAGIYLQYYTVYGLPSWFSGAPSGGIFTGTYSGVSGGTDGYALNTLMMQNGYTGTGTFNLTYSGMNTSTPYILSTTGGSTGGLRQVVLSCPNA